jgi:hypothetical protein
MMYTTLDYYSVAVAAFTVQSSLAASFPRLHHTLLHRQSPSLHPVFVPVLMSCFPAGSAVFHRLAKHFDVVIIDEAAQAVEPSVMVPLVMGCKQVRRAVSCTCCCW